MIIVLHIILLTSKQRKYMCLTILAHIVKKDSILLLLKWRIHLLWRNMVMVWSAWIYICFLYCGSLRPCGKYTQVYNVFQLVSVCCTIIYITDLIILLQTVLRHNKGVAVMVLYNLTRNHFDSLLNYNFIVYLHILCIIIHRITIHIIQNQCKQKEKVQVGHAF